MVSSILVEISNGLWELRHTIDIVLNYIKEPNSITLNALKEAETIQNGELEGKKFSSSHELFKDVIYQK